ncbi:MAG TPA: hypothetical protein VGM91_22780 [Conexibacter sp.]|jgi:hypothetical protein
MSTLRDIATVAAPTVVAIAALCINSRQQSKSRSFDRTEREKERQHDREMREAAQRHQRKLSDLDYQRKLVDDVTEAMEAAYDAVLTLSTRWDSYISFDEEDRNDDILEGPIDAVSRAGDRLKIANARMVLRFGPSHEAIRIVGRAIAAAESAWWAAILREYGERTEKQVTASVNGAPNGMREAVQSFLTVTGGIVGSAPEPVP